MSRIQTGEGLAELLSEPGVDFGVFQHVVGDHGHGMASRVGGGTDDIDGLIAHFREAVGVELELFRLQGGVKIGRQKRMEDGRFAGFGLA